LPISSIGGHETNKMLWKEESFDTTAEDEAQWEGLTSAPVGGKGMAFYYTVERCRCLRCGGTLRHGK